MQEKKAINIEIGGRIKQAREKAGLTQERFAELVGMGAKNVSAIERGMVGISISTLQKICRVLSVSGDRILFEPKQESDTKDLFSRLEYLTPEQFEIAEDILNKLIEAFALNNEDM